MSASPPRTALSSTTANKSPSKPSSSTDPTVAKTSEQTMGENQAEKDSVKSMEYHRQVLKGKLEDESYVAPSLSTPWLKSKRSERQSTKARPRFQRWILG
ncbi:MAG: hypothetical protein HETSPECPRED_005106 [Heterodermia speciosa]|uniref:Uncharacterized protein n=1 Tax=Heterodermia speciosa TaxID=116794 RepID=A0A8H3IKV5_9LECA|nr:MAG: hypothetical protein HETSPECPRED_005106 [Heterodermia speciosa]